MILKDNNSYKIRISCFTKFIRDNHVRVSDKLNLSFLPFNDMEWTDNFIFNSVKEKWREK